MGIAARLRHTVVIQRPTLGARNEYGVRAETWSDLSTVKGWLQPSGSTGTASIAENPDVSSGGSMERMATLFILPTDIIESDRVACRGKTWDVINVHNAAGKDQHYEVTLRVTEVV